MCACARAHFGLYAVVRWAQSSCDWRGWFSWNLASSFFRSFFFITEYNWLCWSSFRIDHRHTMWLRINADISVFVYIFLFIRFSRQTAKSINFSHDAKNRQWERSGKIPFRWQNENKNILRKRPHWLDCFCFSFVLFCWFFFSKQREREGNEQQLELFCKIEHTNRSNKKAKLMIGIDSAFCVFFF